jgi:ADP-heptose:LPS heptosyltransferase
LRPFWQIGSVDFFSLQLGPDAEQLRQLPPSLPIIDHTGHIRDFADTAAFLAELDLVISVDTAVAHLAGALGKPVWTLLPFVPDWRWGLESGRTPWYPTMRLFRQSVRGDWATPIAQAAQALQERARGKT